MSRFLLLPSRVGAAKAQAAGRLWPRVPDEVASREVVKGILLAHGLVRDLVFVLAPRN